MKKKSKTHTAKKVARAVEAAHNTAKNVLAPQTEAVKAVHSKIGASSAYRWFECPGSVRLIKEAPDLAPSPYAEEGTKAHEYLADVLNGKLQVLGIPEPFFTPLRATIDMLRSQFVEASVASELVQPQQRGVVLVEQAFDLSHIFSGLYGTADVVIVDKINKRLTVCDYKHGSGIPVDVVGNKQLLYYALGAFTTLENDYQFETIRLQIIQPRLGENYEISSVWDIDVLTLLDFALELQERALATTLPDAPLKTGDHCRFCPAMGLCPEMRSVAMLSAAEDFGAYVEVTVPTPSDEGVLDKKVSLKAPQTDEEFAKAMSWIPQITAWTKAVKELAYRRVLQGGKIPGFKLVEKRRTRRWIDENEMITFFSKHAFKDHEIYNRKIKSPAQMEKVLNKTDRDHIQGFILAESSGYALVSESDRRAEAIPDGSLDFTKLSSEEVLKLTDGEE